MIKVPLTEDSLRTAMSRIQDFVTVHLGKEDFNEAFVILRESLGIDLENIQTLDQLTTETVKGVEDDDATFMAGVIFGLMVGLIASDYASEA